MKKIIFIIMIFFITISTIDAAEDTFYNVTKFSRLITTIDNLENNSFLAYNSLQLEDGYIVFLDGRTNDNDRNEMKIVRYTNDGKIKWEENYTSSYSIEYLNPIMVSETEFVIATGLKLITINIEDGSVTNEISDNYPWKVEKINDNYLVAEVSDDDYDILNLYDKNFEVKASYKLKDETHYIWATHYDDNNIYFISSYDDCGYHCGGTSEIVTLDKELKEQNLIEINSYLDYAGMRSLIKVDDKFYFTSHFVYEIDEDGNVTEKLSKHDTFCEGICDGKDYAHMLRDNNYIYLAGLDEKDGKIRAFVDIYDLKFNILQEFDINNEFGFSYTTGISITKNITLINDGFIANGGYTAEDGTQNIFVNKYLKKYDVDTKVKGKGTITAITDTAHSGDLVTFTVVPEKGYEIKEVIVTTSTGEKIVFTSNTFTMPSADVTIEAIFTPENPDTNDLPFTLIISIFIISTIYFMYKKKILIGMEYK